MYADGELLQQYAAASVRRESIVRRAIGLAFAFLVALVLAGAWFLSGWLLLGLGPLTEAFLLSRWSRRYFRTGLVVASVTAPAPPAPFPFAIDADLMQHFQGGGDFSLLFHPFSPRALAFRGRFFSHWPDAWAVAFLALAHLVWPLLFYGEVRNDGTSPRVTVRGQCAWSFPVCLLLLGWGLLNGGSRPLELLLLSAISAFWLVWVRSRVHAIARTVTTLLELQGSR